MLYRKVKLILVICPVLIWLLAPTISMGEEGYPGKWWHAPRVAEYIGINNEEKKELDDLFVKNRRSLIDLKSSLEKERFELDILLEKQSLDEAAVTKQFKKLDKARSNLANERFQFLLKVRNILGSERYHRLKTSFREFKERRLQGQNRLHKPDRP